MLLADPPLLRTWAPHSRDSLLAAAWHVASSFPYRGNSQAIMLRTPLQQGWFISGEAVVYQSYKRRPRIHPWFATGGSPKAIRIPSQNGIAPLRLKQGRIHPEFPLAPVLEEASFARPLKVSGGPMQTCRVQHPGGWQRQLGLALAWMGMPVQWKPKGKSAWTPRTHRLKQRSFSPVGSTWA